MNFSSFAKNTQVSFYRSFLSSIPEIPPNVRLIYKDNQLISLEQTRNTFLGHLLIFLFKLPKSLTVDLDLMGTKVIELCNGKNTILAIGKILSEQLDQKSETLYPRIIQFLRILKSHLYIKFSKPQRAQ